MEYICFDCPRKCGIKRSSKEYGGACSSPSLPVIARAAPHFGEEPCISGTNGSGTIFFSGCNLKCVFCQNHSISRGNIGKAVSVERLVDIFKELQDTGVHNINLVTPTHFTHAIIKALEAAKLSIPVVWNTSGYENTETIKLLEGLVQIFMPDFKYMDSSLAYKYSSARNYPEKAASSILEMYRQCGPFKLDENGIMQSGVIIRHLILPGQLENTKSVIDWISSNLPTDGIIFSLMSQYTPMSGTYEYPELQNAVTSQENEAMINYMRDCGIENGFWQDTASATDVMIPDFDLTGV